MIRGIERKAIFKSDHDREELIKRLSHLLPETKTCCYAWVLMRNHSHFLFRSGPGGMHDRFVADAAGHPFPIEAWTINLGVPASANAARSEFYREIRDQLRRMLASNSRTA